MFHLQARVALYMRGEVVTPPPQQQGVMGPFSRDIVLPPEVGEEDWMDFLPMRKFECPVRSI